MVGCFGLRDDHHHTRVPPDLIVEANPRLDVWMASCNAAGWQKMQRRNCSGAKKGAWSPDARPIFGSMEPEFR